MNLAIFVNFLTFFDHFLDFFDFFINHLKFFLKIYFLHFCGWAGVHFPLKSFHFDQYYQFCSIFYPFMIRNVDYSCQILLTLYHFFNFPLLRRSSEIICENFYSTLIYFWYINTYDCYNNWFLYIDNVIIC